MVISQANNHSLVISQFLTYRSREKRGVAYYHIMSEIFYLGSRSHHDNVSMNGHREKLPKFCDAPE